MAGSSLVVSKWSIYDQTVVSFSLLGSFGFISSCKTKISPVSR